MGGNEVPFGEGFGGGIVLKGIAGGTGGGNEIWEEPSTDVDTSDPSTTFIADGEANSTSEMLSSLIYGLSSVP
jgi:hypothetical protein